MKFSVWPVFAPLYSGFLLKTACWLGVYFSSVYGPEPIVSASGCLSLSG
jgi:hypothetical protein